MKRVFTFFAVALFLVVKTAPAALEFTLTPAVQSGAKGIEITFSATLHNTSATDDLFLNDLRIDLNGAAISSLAPNGNVYFANVPGILGPGEAYDGPICAITINSSANPDDYTGTMTVRGGADIFATTDLQSQNFQVSSPLVSIAASTSDAYEFGPVPGIFTVGRSGSSNYDLLVHYSIAGSAGNGSRYNHLTGLVTIPSGTGAATIDVNPIPNDIADGDQTVSLTISPFSTYNVGVPVSATVTIHDKPIDAWRLQKFGNDANNPAIAGDAADPDGDAISNLMEYALFSDPKIASAPDLPSIASNSNHLQLSFHRNTGATDITYVVEGCSNLATGNWSAVMTRAPSGGWMANLTGATAAESGSGDFVQVTITDPVILSAANQRFLRLRVQR